MNEIRLDIAFASEMDSNPFVSPGLVSPIFQSVPPVNFPQYSTYLNTDVQVVQAPGLYSDFMRNQVESRLTPLLPSIADF